MKRILLMMAVWLVASVTMAANDTDTLVMRIKGMRCEECAHKVGGALRKYAGVEGIDFDLEKRVARVAYDPARVSADTLLGRLRGTRYNPTPYSRDEVIRRGMGLKVQDMHCQRCAKRIAERLGQMEGIDSLSPDVEKHYVFVRYDANKTSKDNIREVLSGMGFTPVNYYTSKNISYAYFLLPEDEANDETLETALSLDGVDDANVSRLQKSLAITFVNDETSEQQLLEQLRQSGIKAEIPAPHECKEK
jgi:copper ion binding protein